MKVVIRADASHEIGIGHVMRCLTLADHLVDAGAQCHFLCRGQVLAEEIERRHFFHELMVIVGQEDKEDQGMAHAHWLPEGWRADAIACISVLESLGVIDWLVVDHYALDAKWESAMRQYCTRVMAIDDLADRRHDCDLLLDQNLAREMQSRYVEKIPVAANSMLGPYYALLRREFSDVRLQTRSRDGIVRQIFLFMGGGDSSNTTGMVLDALSQSKHGHLPVDVVVGGANPHVSDIQVRSAKLPNARLHLQVDNMAELMGKADLAIGATGVSTWERAALGLPTLAVSMADNQRDIARHAEASGLLTWLGDAENVSAAEWARHIDEACSSADILRSQSQTCLALVDASGAQRVVEAML